MRKISPLLIIFVASTLIASNISPELQKIISLANPNEYIPITIIVKEKVTREKLEKFSYYPKPERRKKIIEYLKQETPKYTSPIINEIKDDKNSYKNLNELFITSVVVVDAKPDLIKRLTRLDDIEWIYFRKKVPAIIESITPFDILEISWGIRQIKANLVWNNYGVKGEDVLIAIIDTGVDYHHPSLIKRVWRNPGEIPWNGVDDDGNGYIDDTYGWDFSGRTANPTDQKGHGTFVCGIACGDSIGGNIIGTAPKARFVSVKVLDRTGSGEENWAWEGIQYALIVGADVANLSIGWRNSEPHARGVWRNIIDNSMEAGMVVVVGAGNEGDEENAPYSIRTPGDVPRAITVGATTGSDAVADFSSVGPVTWADVPPYYDYPYPPGLLKPDITAPGVNIFSSVLGGDFQSGWNGTSMATPFVSGTVALIIQANPDLSPDSIKTLLELTADDIYVRGPDTLSGYGRINALRAVETAMGNSFGTISVTIYPQAKTIITDSRRRFTIDETSSFTIDLQAPMEYQAILSAYGFFPETLLFTLSPGTTITRNITLRPRPLHNVRFEIRDFDTGELVAQSFIEFMGSRYECSPGNPGVVNFALPENDSVEIFFGAPGYILSKMVISYTSRRKTIFIHKSIDFESESLFTPTAGVDWQWGAP
ncbi:MAG: S8 family peptidase, partial [bacterium]